MLTAFDIAKGEGIWRLPLVGIAGMFFGGDGNIYLNATTADQDSLTFSKQIDLGNMPSAQVVKVDAANGAVLWRVEPGGELHYVSGEFLYTLRSYMPDETDEDMDGLPGVESGYEKPPYLKLKRLHPRNGRVLFEHFQQRAPLDLRFEENTIRFVFKKEVQLLKFLSF
jgi:outer membrane protein assembly factor BamB